MCPIRRNSLLVHVTYPKYLGLGLVVVVVCMHITLFYLVDDIYDTKPTFSYQYLIIYSVQYERPICARIPDISPNIRNEENLIRYDPDIRYLELCSL